MSEENVDEAKKETNKSTATVDKLTDRSTNIVELITGTNDTATPYQNPTTTDELKNYLDQKLGSVITTRQGYYGKLLKYRDNMLVNAIYDILMNDVIVDTGKGDFFTVKVEEHSDIEEELKSLFVEFNIPELVVSILPDIMHYGGYPLHITTEDKKGIVNIVDKYDIDQVIPIVDSVNYPLFFFVKKVKTDGTYAKQYLYKSISSVAYFTVGLDTMKLRLDQTLIQWLKRKIKTFGKAAKGNAKAVKAVKKFKTFRDQTEETVGSNTEGVLDASLFDSIPSTYKVKLGQSVVWNVLDEIAMLSMLRKATVADTIAKILTPRILGIPIPDLYDPDEAIKVTSRYEDMLNGGTSGANYESSEWLMKRASAIKCIPIVGERSRPEQIQVRDEAKFDPRENQDSLEVVLTMLGIPVELFNGQTDSRAAMRINARYSKMVKTIQRSICKTLVGVCLLHISKKYPNREILDTDIDITLKCNVNYDEVENIESTDLVIAAADSMNGLLETLEERVTDTEFAIDNNAFLAATKDILQAIGTNYKNVIVKKKDPGERGDAGDESLITETPIDPEQEMAGENHQQDLADRVNQGKVDLENAKNQAKERDAGEGGEPGAEGGEPQPKVDIKIKT